ncbi:MAG TPA: cytochrome c biogenesis heme-transporting ATPase CcmA [Marinagarivorans sp.]
MLQLNKFTCTRDDEPLFVPIDVSIKAGEVIQVAGPNGAGKTTMLRALCGLFDSFDGEILWRDQPVSRSRFAFLSQLLYLGHQPGIKKSLTARENLQWFARIKGETHTVNVEAALAEVGLDGYADIPCHQMSAGQHRRVGLARLYFDASPFWILDEPFTAIDKAGVARLEERVKQHAYEGGTVILTTHQALSLESYRAIELEKYRGALQ